jgi:hypothetical protein
MGVPQAIRLMELQRVTFCLNKGVAQLAQDELILTRAVEGNY